MRFAEIATSITERVDDPSTAGVDRYVGLEHLDPDSTRIRRWGSPTDVESTKLRFYTGDVVYGRRRAYQRKLGVADFDGICSAHALVLRAKPSVCLPEFLPYFLQSEAFHQRALDISVGSLSPTINWKTLAVQEFALSPIDEQSRGVEVMAALDKALDGHTQLPIRALRDAVLFAMDRDGQGRKCGGAVPGWSKVTLGDIAKLDCLRVTVNDDYEYLIAGVANAGQGVIARPSIRGSQTNYPQLHRLRARQLVMRKLTAWEGPIAVVPDSFEGWFVSPEFPTFTLDETRVLADYMGLLCQRPEMWASMAGVSSGTVERRKRATPSQLLSIRADLPPLEAQARLVEEVRAVDRLAQASRASVQSLRSARRATLETILGGTAG